MDRTKASDAFNAGSIPVSCMRERVVSRKLMTNLIRIRDLVISQGKFVFPVLAILALGATAGIAIGVHNNKAASSEASSDALAGEQSSSVNSPYAEVDPAEIPFIPMEKDAYPAVNALVKRLYVAQAAGDVETMESLRTPMTDTEKFRVEEFAKYVDRYVVDEVYTKPGPVDGTYIAIVCNSAVFTQFPDDALPGYTTFYVCPRVPEGTGQETAPDEVETDALMETDALGGEELPPEPELYLNVGLEGASESDVNYIQTVLMQDDFVDLNNRIEVEYKDLCLQKPELYTYISDTEAAVQTAVGDRLARIESGQPDPGADGSGSESEEPEEPGIVLPAAGHTTDTVNLRASASIEADKISQVPVNTAITVMEILPNGWSRVQFGGSSGFISSEYIQLETQTPQVQTPNGPDIPAPEYTAMTTTTDVNIRQNPDKTSTKLGSIVSGSIVKVIGTEGDWSKLWLDDGRTGYVMTKFLQ